MELKEAIAQIRKGEKREFDQTVDLLVSLKGLDLRRDNISFITTIPHPFKEKKICGFLEGKSDLIKTITKPEFDRFKEKKELKSLVRDYDFFIASAKLMPSVATTFGKALGPVGKMPSPQLGVVMQETPQAIEALIKKITHSVKVKVKEPAVKVAVGKEKMTDEQIEHNIRAIYDSVIAAMPAKRENIRKVMIKLTMGAPIAVEIK